MGKDRDFTFKNTKQAAPDSSASAGHNKLCEVGPSVLS